MSGKIEMFYLTADRILIDRQWLSNLAVGIKDGQIAEICPVDAIKEPYLVLEDKHLIPPLFDIQVNGGGGVLFNDALTIEGLKTILNAHQSVGTAALLPTLITDKLLTVREAASAISEFRLIHPITVPGVHFEGPFLNPNKKGVHDAQYMHQKESDFLEILDAFELGRVLVTLAPECVSPEFVDQLRQRSVIISVGHTTATYEQSLQAVKQGVTGFTHLFNAMPQMLSRDPGPIAADLNNKECYAGIIADGIHVHSVNLALTITTKRTDKTILVSDAMPCVGNNDQSFELYGETIQVKDKACRTNEGALAGSAISLSDAVRYCQEELDLSDYEAIEMATQTPARFMGLENKIGSIRIGNAALFSTVDKTGNYGVCDQTLV